MYLEIIKPFLIGICASAPIGPVAFLVMQRTIKYGRKGGFCTSMGASLVDSFYSVICFLTASLISGFIDTNRRLIMTVGGSLILILGLVSAIRNPFKNTGDTPPKPKKRMLAAYGAQALGYSLANPAALIFMAALVAMFNVDNNVVGVPVSVGLVFAGTVAYWVSFTALINFFRSKMSIPVLSRVSRVSGVVIAIFGAVLIFKGITL